MVTKLSITQCKAQISDGILNFDIKVEETDFKLENTCIYKLAISSLYLYCLCLNNDSYKFEPYELGSMMEHVPYIPCTLDFEVFTSFVQNTADTTDLFMMLEALTLQALYLDPNEYNNDILHSSIEKFKTLNQKMISKIKEYKDIIACIQEETIQEIISIFKVFDGDTIAYVNFDAIKSMIIKNKDQVEATYGEINTVQFVALFKQLTLHYKIAASQLAINLNNELVYKTK